MRLRAPPLLLPLIILLCAAPGDAQVILESSARYAKTKVAASPDGGYLSADFSQALFWQPQGGMLVNGTNIMVMADTQNQAIRKVDWGERTVGHLAGNPGVQGDCLDQSCPANSFTDGVGLAATFTMPYAVQLHHQQRHAFVADTRSGAIRRVHLYTNQAKHPKNPWPVPPSPPSAPRMLPPPV